MSDPPAQPMCARVRAGFLCFTSMTTCARCWMNMSGQRCRSLTLGSARKPEPSWNKEARPRAADGWCSGKSPCHAATLPHLSGPDLRRGAPRQHDRLPCHSRSNAPLPRIPRELGIRVMPDPPASSATSHGMRKRSEQGWARRKAVMPGVRPNTTRDKLAWLSHATHWGLSTEERCRSM